MRKEKIIVDLIVSVNFYNQVIAKLPLLNDLGNLTIAKSKKFKVLNSSEILVKLPKKYTSKRKISNWIKNHFSKKQLEKFLTCSQHQGACKVNIEKIILEK